MRSSPRISANELGLFVLSNLSNKRRIVRAQKYPNPLIVGRYNSAKSAILRSFEDGRFKSHLIQRELEILREKLFSGKYASQIKSSNIAAVVKFLRICDAANPPNGEHKVIRRNASFQWDGVTISAFPNIVTEDRANGFFTFTKLRFSNHKYAADASQVVLIVLMKYAERHAPQGLEFSCEHAKVIDCFSQQIFSGLTSSKFYERLLNKAMSEIANIWSSL